MNRRGFFQKTVLGVLSFFGIHSRKRRIIIEHEEQGMVGYYFGIFTADFTKEIAENKPKAVEIVKKHFKKQSENFINAVQKELG